MSTHEEPRIRELEALRPPPRSEAQRRSSREAILARAAPFLARRPRHLSSWDILAGWARPGLAAAAAIAALLLWLQLPQMLWPIHPEPVLDEVLRDGGPESVPAVLVSASEPNSDAVLAALLDEGQPHAPSLTNPTSGRER